MGCDIHVQVDWQKYADRPNDHDGGWSAMIWYGKIHLPRSYRMFGALVQGHSRYPDDGAAPPERGQVNIEVEERYGPDGVLGDHTYSWVTLAELDAAIARVEAEWPGTRFYEYRAVAEFMRELERSGKPTRMVFGFDN